MSATWRDEADRVLAELWQRTRRNPSKQDIYDAYPFGMREYTPYRIWLEEVRWFKAGCPVVSAKHPGHRQLGKSTVYVPPPEQQALI